MKKMGSIAMAILLAGSVAACGNTAADINAAAPVKAAATQVQQDSSKILIVYFSRWGNTDYPNNVDATTSASIVARNGQRQGTTEYLARLIQEQTGGDLYLIETKKPYPTDFDELVDVNHQEIAAGARPELRQARLDLAKYDTIFIGYPVWANTVPQAVASFLEANNLQGKKVIPFCTHDGFSSGRSYNAVRSLSSGTEVMNGLAVEAKDVPAAGSEVAQWLQGLELTKSAAQVEEVPVNITISGQTIKGVFDSTPLAREIQAMLPLTVSMVGYGGREYYGGMPARPQNISGGSLFFNNGDITYCPRNNTLAIFYAKARHDQAPLTMEVIKIGRVTSDLAVFDSFGSSENITFSLEQ